jgi:UDP-glucose 4-epimerase
MRSLVTGGAGFIGSHIARALLDGGSGVRILDDMSTGRMDNLEGIERGVELLRADVRDASAVRRAVEGVDTVFHLAAQVSVPLSVAEPALTYEVNVIGTSHLLEACAAAGARRIVFSSSCAVYGDAPVLPKSEGMLPEPLSPYASSKVAGEHLMTMYARLHGLETVSLRYFNVFGPRQDPASEYAAVIPRFIERMESGKRPIIFGDGRQTRDFIYVGNVVEANLAAARAPGLSGQVLNVGSGTSIDLLGLVAELNAILGTDLEPVLEDPRPGDVRESASSIELARDVLGWSPRVGLSAGLSETAAWFDRTRGAHG